MRLRTNTVPDCLTLDKSYQLCCFALKLRHNTPKTSPLW
nr:MAG TPA: hypothetical protein [Caudoviricetes sp.]